MPPPAAPVLYKTVDVGATTFSSMTDLKARVVETGSIIWVGPHETFFQKSMIVLGFLLHVCLWLGAGTGLSFAVGKVGSVDIDDTDSVVLVCYLSFVVLAFIIVLIHAACFGEEHADEASFRWINRAFYTVTAIHTGLGIALLNAVSSLHYKCLTIGTTEAEWLCNLDSKHCGGPSSPPPLAPPSPSPSSSTSSGRMLSETSTTMCLGGSVGDYPVNDDAYWAMTLPFYLLIIATFLCAVNISRLENNRQNKNQATAARIINQRPPPPRQMQAVPM